MDVKPDNRLFDTVLFSAVSVYYLADNVWLLLSNQLSASRQWEMKRDRMVISVAQN